MNILFLHRAFPGQFQNLLKCLAPCHRITFVTSCKNIRASRIQIKTYELPGEPPAQNDPYMHGLSECMLHGEGAANIVMALKNTGYKPDFIMGHSWGPTLFMKDIFPDVPFIGYFEWFLSGSYYDFGVACNKQMTPEGRAHIRAANAPFLIDLCSCDGGIVPTAWQHQQFPSEFHSKLSIIHDGIDVDYFKPSQVSNGLHIPSIPLDIPPDKEIVTYTTRGMEPCRGFPQFMEAVALVLKNRPNCHVVIAGDDQVCYGLPPEDGKTYKQLMLEKLSLDMSRVHFTGFLTLSDYRKILQASWVHVYLSYPFVLSWSMLEAMATGCLLVTSDTPPVTEVVEHGINGFLVDFFVPNQLAEKITEALEHNKQLVHVRQAARDTIMQKYTLQHCLSKQLALLRSVMVQKTPCVS